MDQRIAERRARVRREQRRRRLRRTLLLTAVAAVAMGLLVVERSGLVALDEVRVTGTVRLDPDVVREAAGLELGTSTLRLDLGAATRRVEALPLVREARIRRSDPLTVVIEVTERVPVMVVRAGDEQVLVDEAGVVIAAGSEPGLVVVDTVGPLPPPGRTVAALPAAAAAHAIHMRLSGALAARVVRYEAADPRGVVAVLDDGTRVEFGGPDRIDEKVRALGAILEDLGAVRVSAIDVRAPRAPVVRP